MSSPSHAVFLSYASQDGDAVKRICEALQAAGVEVWFDRDELTGGDAWDQKIRGQIKSCSLFVPVISAATNARREGYFRREWKLAVERTHDMDEALPFLLPVVIDATTDAGAFVPEKFREVQWTRLPGGETNAVFCRRVKALIEGEPPASARSLSPLPTKSAPSPVTVSPRRGLPIWIWGAVGVLVLGAGYAVFKSRSSSADSIAPSIQAQKSDAVTSSKSTTPGPSPIASSEAAQWAERAYALTQRISFTRDDLAQAESQAKTATDLEPNSARAWSVRAWVQAAYLMRNWDYSERRMQDTQAFANRALSLREDDADALNALIQVLEKQGAYQEQEKLARRAVASDPHNVRSSLSLGRALTWLNRIDEARGILRQAIAADPSNPLRHYELANSYAGFGYGRQPTSAADVDVALSELSQALTQSPSFGTALMAKAVLLGARKGDMAGMHTQVAEMAKLPLSERSSERGVFVAMQCALWERQPAPVFAAAALTAQTYFDDLVVALPKAWLTALAYQLLGRENSARQEWQVAEAALRQKLNDKPADPQTLRAQLAVTLAWLGRDAEAEKEMQPLEAAWREELNPRTAGLLARYYAARGDTAKTMPYLETAIDKNGFLTRVILRFDPWWDKLRGQAAFDAFVQRPPSFGTVSTASGAAFVTAPTTAGSSRPADPQLRRAVEILDAGETVAADLGVAEDLIKGFLTAHPTDAEATLLMGRLQTYYLLRGFDRSDERFALARQAATRGLALAPNDPEALCNMAVYLYRRGTEFPRAAKLLRQAIAARPGEARYYRMLDNVLAVTPGVSDEEVIESARHATEIFPNDALVHYELARHYRDSALLEPAMRSLERAIALGPVVNAIIVRATLKLAVLGDRTELEKLDDTLPERYRSSDRAVYAQFILASASGNYARGLDALTRTPEPWMIDFDYTGPVSLIKGELLLMQHKPELARIRFEEARIETAKHPVDFSRNFSSAWLDPWILMRCGKTTEARARNAVLMPELQRPFRIFLGTNWWFSPIPMNLLLGERAQAITFIKEAVQFPYGAQVIKQGLAMDPRMAPWKNDAEIVAVLKAVPAPSAQVP